MEAVNLPSTDSERDAVINSVRYQAEWLWLLITDLCPQQLWQTMRHVYEKRTGGLHQLVRRTI